MGRLIASVREAEERLAGLARALQSAWEEEVAEASSAREAARRSLQKADAMAEAAGSLGRQELASRLAAVAQQLRSVEERASGRLEVLMRTERDLQLRLEAPMTRPLPVPPALDTGTRIAPPSELTLQPKAAEEVEAESVPAVEAGLEAAPAAEAVIENDVATGEAVTEAVTEAAAVEAEVEAEIEIVSGEDDEAEEVILEVDAEITAPPVAPAPVAPAAPRPPVPAPAAPAQGLARRVEELERVAGRLPASVLEPALEELVALTRLMGKGADQARSEQAALLRKRLRTVAARRGRETTFGLSDDEFADWASLAAQARARRQAEVERVKATRPRPNA